MITEMCSINGDLRYIDLHRLYLAFSPVPSGIAFTDHLNNITMEIM